MALTFKSAFTLIGLGAYLILFLELPIKPVAVGLCVIFAGLNINGVKNVGRFQGIFVSIILGLLAFFIAKGLFHTESAKVTPFFEDFGDSFWEAVGIVYIFFAGITKIASVAEEVEDLERNISYSMIIALSLILVIYALGFMVVAGVMNGEALAGSMTPIADAAAVYLGPEGKSVLSIGAIFAFVTHC